MIEEGILAVFPSAVLASQEEILAWAKKSPELAVPLTLTGLALLALALIRLRRLPVDLRARKSPTLDPTQLEDLMLGNPPQIIDLREQREFRGERGHIRGSVNIPYRELPARVRELETSPPRPIVLVDETDALSHRAMPLLTSEGHRWIYVLKGGLHAWRQRKLPIYKAQGVQRK